MIYIVLVIGAIGIASRNRQEMCAHCLDRRFRFQRSSDSQQVLTATRIAPPLFKISHQPSRPFQPNQRQERKPSGPDLRGQLFGSVEFRCGEELEFSSAVSVNPVGEIALYN